jgi:hypothetical protein
MPQTPLDAVRVLAQRLTRVVTAAAATLRDGRHVDLAGLDSEVGLLCAKSLDLPPEEGRRVRPWLVGLSGGIEALSQALAARRRTE